MRITDKLFGAPTPGIQWRRGLARLWLIAAMLWAGLVTYFQGFPSSGLYPWEIYQQLEEDTKLAKTSPTETPVFDPTKISVQGDGQVIVPDSIKIKYFCKHLTAYLSMVLGPPIAVFILGCAFFWVIRGFRPTSQHP